MKYELYTFSDLKKLNVAIFALKLVLCNIKMNSKTHVNNLEFKFFLDLEQHLIAN